MGVFKTRLYIESINYQILSMWLALHAYHVPASLPLLLIMEKEIKPQLSELKLG